MYNQNNKMGDILLKDWIDYIHNKVGQEQWVTVYFRDIGTWGVIQFYCALIPNSMAEESLSNHSWDLHLGHGQPGCSMFWDSKGNEIITYHRYGSDDGIEPLIHCRDFYGVKKDYVEVSEEFRHFHNLYHDRANSKFIKITDSATEEDIILMENNRVQIQLKPLKQFLAIKDMHLAIFFAIDRYSDRSLADLGLKKDERIVKHDNLCYQFFIEQFSQREKKPTLSSLVGKKLILGMSKQESGFPPYNKTEEYEHFIIGTDEEGEPIFNTCNPDELANFFGRNPGAAHYFAPVFFRRDVLTKYYSKPEVYSIEDGYIRCKGLWGLRVDNNHDKYLIVFLGDLGRDMPASERLYWKSFNVPPDGTISGVNWKRSFLGEFADPEKADLAFKYQFNIFQEKWAETFGWPLFKPLSKEDEHNFKVLRVPVSDDQYEFDQQSMALCKVIVDSLNEEQISRQIKGIIPKGAKGITKLSQWLEERDVTGSEACIKFLRSLQDLRIGAGHRKGKDYHRGATYFRLYERPLSSVFEDILRQANDFLNSLDRWLLLMNDLESQDRTERKV